jgi:hypothetical protein
MAGMRILLLLLAAPLACSSTPSVMPPPMDAGLAPGTVIDKGAYKLTVLAPAGSGTCDAHASSSSQFTDTTEEWGLSGVSLGGYYAGDLNRDGYPDMVMLSGAQSHRQKIGAPERDVVVMMNRGTTGARAFVDETAESGLFQTRSGSTTEYRSMQMGAIADVNGDGAPDVYSGVVIDANNMDKTSSFNEDKSEILLNDGKGHFTLADQSDPSMKMLPQNYQAVFADVDNDGNLDLLLTYWYKKPGSTYFGSQAQLFQGAGDGTFLSITESAGLKSDNSNSTMSLLNGTSPRPSFGAAACDLDGDLLPELLVSSYGGESNMLYANKGGGKLERLVAPGAFDGDTNVDYHDNQMFMCWCVANAGNPDCANVAAPKIQCAGSQWNPTFDAAPAMLNGNNFSAACRDMDGDGKPEVFQSTIRHWWAGNSTDPSTLMLNRTQPGGPITLERTDGEKNGITFPHLDPQGWNEGIQQVTLVDLDNDGRPDILTGGSDYAYQRGHAFIQQADGSYKDLAKAMGLDFPCMDGLAVADFDRDGDLDIVVRGSLYRDCATGWGAVADDPGFNGWKTPEVHVFSNNASEHAKWLEVRLLSDGTSNKTAIGATVTITTNGVRQTQQVLAAHGIGSESDNPGVLFFGLGNCAGVDSIEVKWPNGAKSVEVWKNVPAGHLVELHQADSTLYAVN